MTRKPGRRGGTLSALWREADVQIDNAELLARIEALENPANQGRSLDAVTWAQLVVGCLVLPAVILWWGF